MDANLLPPFDYFDHLRAWQVPHHRKQAERATRIEQLSVSYKGPFTLWERETIKKPIAELVQDVHKGAVRPVDVLHAYSKVAVKAHEKTNCLTEVLLPEAESWAENEVDLKGPLAGIPVSLKDTAVVKGFDTTVGYSRNVGKPADKDGTLVKLLKDAGAVPYVKTALPITLLSFESTNDVWGRCSNPHNSAYSPGGSTGGEAALLALGGRIGIGTDVAGSVRAPAHFSGIYALRCSTGRWPKMGLSTSMAGQEGVLAVASPMARTLDDLVYFSKAIWGMKPERYDHTVHPIPWREDDYQAIKKKSRLRIGIMRTDGVVDPTPAVARALHLVSSALSAQGHDLIEITPPPALSSFSSSSASAGSSPCTPPSPYLGLQLASTLLNADGCATFLGPFRTFERSDPGAAQLSLYASLPRILRYVHYLYVRYVRRDPVWAGLLRRFGAHSVAQQWALVARREAYRAAWHAWWRDRARLDLLVCPPFATPAVPHAGMRHAVAACGYTFLWNLLDYAAGVLPVTRVDAAADAVDEAFDVGRLSGVARGAWGLYDAAKMQGLPVGVQVVGRRWGEEEVLAGMEVVESALREKGVVYEPLEID
ncbi:MAG: hypothetical protein LQ340_001062 [Diploschistes diacapsis]|nr:MAG: hypothetical protein LQ340_001062 [Diploschistes diacapsis]